jgi:class 3 adenylate cyclase
VEPRVQYTRTKDGVSIAFRAIGEGEPLIFMPSMPMSHIEYEWQFPEWRAFYERFAERRRIIRYDGRGTGLSDRRPMTYSMETLQLDLDAVVEKLGLDRFALFAAYHPGPVAVRYSVQNPDKVTHLVLWCTFARAKDLDSPAIQATRSLIEQDWEVYTQTAARVLLGWNAGEAAQKFARFIHEANSPEGVLSLLHATTEFDVTDMLEQVTVPTLVLHRGGIPWLSLDLARNLAGHIPNTRLAVLEGESIAPYLGDVDAVVNTTLEFLGEETAPRRGQQSSLRTILFTDIEAHTLMMRRLGDHKGREVLRDYERLTREALKAHGGSEIKTMGDGFMASFDSAQRALQCAVTLQRSFAEYSKSGPTELKVRVGLNAGEPIAEEGDLFGTAVIMAARCAAEARGGEILATDVVRQLAGGRAFEFADRGQFMLRGLEDAVRLYEVKWR